MAGYYDKFTKLVLTDEFIDDLANRRIDEFEGGLKRNLPKFAEFPQQAQEALLDMSFNLGLQGLMTKISNAHQTR